MKKLFLFVAVATLGLTSCSSDDDKGGNGGSTTSELKVTIDGVTKTFNTIVVNEQSFPDSDGGEPFIQLTVTATIDNDPSEMIVLVVGEGDTGADAMLNFRYQKDGKEYGAWHDNTNLSSVVQTNSNKKLKGTFVGNVGNYNNDWELTIVSLTNGSFDISY